jgi:hypothetical protein
MAQRNDEKTEDVKILSRKRKIRDEDKDNYPPLVDLRSVRPSGKRQPNEEDDGESSSSSSEDDDVPLMEMRRGVSESSYSPSDIDEDEEYKAVVPREPENKVLPLHDDLVWCYLVGNYQVIFDETGERVRHGDRNTVKAQIGLGILSAYKELWGLDLPYKRIEFHEKVRYHRNLLTKGEICRQWLLTFYRIASTITTISNLEKAFLVGRLQGYWWFLSQMVDQTKREAEVPSTSHMMVTTTTWRLFYSSFRERALVFMPKTVPRMRQMFRDIFLKPVYIAMSRIHLRRAVPPSATQLMKFKVAMDVLFCVLPENQQARR